MQTPRALALVFLSLGGAQLACTGSIGEQTSEPPPRPVAPAAAAGSSGQAVETTSTVSSTPTAETSSTNASTGQGGAGGGSETIPGPLDVAALPPIEFCDAPTKVLMASCGNGSCHSNPGATIGDFGVDSLRAYNFVDSVSRRHADCGKIIDSEDYSKSLLLTKVTGDFESPRCGERMPVGSFLITEEQIDCLSSWLQQFQL